MAFTFFPQIILHVGDTVQFRSNDRLLIMENAKKKRKKRAEKAKTGAVETVFEGLGGACNPAMVSMDRKDLNKKKTAVETDLKI